MCMYILDMSTEFKQRRAKKRHIDEIQTLGDLHKKAVAKFRRQRRDLPRKKKELEELQIKLNNLEKKSSKEYNTSDIMEKAQLKNDTKKLEDWIYDVENNISEMEYYSRIAGTLMDYGDICDDDDDPYIEVRSVKIKRKKPDKLDKHNMVLKKKRKKVKAVKKRKIQIKNTKNEITKYLQCTEEKNNKPDVETLMHEYIMFTQNEYITHNPRGKVIKMCDFCDIEKTLRRSEGAYVCGECGECDMIVIESETPNYKDPIPDKPGYPYKRYWLAFVVDKTTASSSMTGNTKKLREYPKAFVTNLLKKLNKGLRENLRELYYKRYCMGNPQPSF